MPERTRPIICCKHADTFIKQTLVVICLLEDTTTHCGGCFG